MGNAYVHFVRHVVCNNQNISMYFLHISMISTYSFKGYSHQKWLKWGVVSAVKDACVSRYQHTLPSISSSERQELPSATTLGYVTVCQINSENEDNCMQSMNVKPLLMIINQNPVLRYPYQRDRSYWLHFYIS